MAPIEKVTVRLPDDVVAVLKALVERQKFVSVQDAVREAVRRLISSELTAEDISAILMTQMDDRVKMEDLMSDNSSESMDEALKRAVSDYVRSRMGPGG